MVKPEERRALVRAIIDENLYMVLATADEAGKPWATPVYYAVSDHREFFWVSSPEARHSRNIGLRSEVAIVIFDSRAAIGTGQGVYMPAVAEEVAAVDLERGIGVFSERAVAHGGSPWTRDDVKTDMRLYRATASEHSVLAKDGRPDHRLIVDL